MQREEILKKGESTASKVSIAVFFFALAKVIIALISGSVALLSDGVHSLTDTIESFFVWLGFKISQKKPTEKFPYGFYKAENIVAFFVSFLIILAGFEIARESFQRIFSFQPLNLAYGAIAIALSDAVFLFFLGRYETKIGKEINSQSITAQGKELTSHIFSSSLVVGGIISTYLGIPKIEGIVGLLLSLLVFKIGLESIKDSILSLMDISPSKEIEKKVKNLLLSIPNIQGFSGLKLRRSGPFIFGEVNIKIEKSLAVQKAHEIADEIEKKTKETIPQLDSFIIHIEPSEIKEPTIIIPVNENNQLNSLASKQFGRAYLFAIVKIKENKLSSLEFIENPYKEKSVRAGLSVSKFLAEKKPDILITKEIGPISFHTLRDNLVQIYKAEDGTIKEVINKFLENKLKKIEQPTRIKE